MSSLKKVIRQLILTSAGLACALTAKGQGCNLPPVQGTPPCIANPVPCAHCAGTWTDATYGSSWTVSSDTNPPEPGIYPVSGNVTMASPVPGCPSVTWSITGTIAQTQEMFGSTKITWNGDNPDPDEDCGGLVPVSHLTFYGLHSQRLL